MDTERLWLAPRAELSPDSIQQTATIHSGPALQTSHVLGKTPERLYMVLTEGEDKYPTPSPR